MMTATKNLLRTLFLLGIWAIVHAQSSTPSSTIVAEGGDDFDSDPMDLPPMEVEPESAAEAEEDASVSEDDGESESEDEEEEDEEEDSVSKDDDSTAGEDEEEDSVSKDDDSTEGEEVEEEASALEYDEETLDEPTDDPVDDYVDMSLDLGEEEDEEEIEEEVEELTKVMEDIISDVTIIEEEEDGGARRYLEGATGCKIVKNMRELASLNGKTETLCSFEFTRQNGGCAGVGNGGIGITKKTSLTCEKGGSCHINCHTRHFHVRKEFDLIGNFILEGSIFSAIALQDGNLNMMGATLKNNPRLPAIWAWVRGTVSVCNSTFEGNGFQGTNEGGAILLHPFAKVRVSGSTFRNNKARNKGGAIYAVGRRGQEAFADIQTSIFEGNTARFGDHIYSEPHPNHANGFKTDACTGGTKFSGSKTCNGISWGHHMPRDCVTQENACLVPKGAGAFLVGLDKWESKPEGVCARFHKDVPRPWDPSSCVPIEKMSDLQKLSTLQRQKEGGLSGISVTLCPFHLSKQNGGCDRGMIGSARGTTSLTCKSEGSCKIECPAKHHIYLGIHNGVLELNGNFLFSRAIDNSANVRAGTLNLRGVTFKRNSGGHAGAIFLHTHHAHANICDCTFEDNTSTRGGAGAIRTYVGNRLMISGSTFRRNSSPGGRGGAIYADGNHPNNAVMVAIKYSTFEDNWARDDGDHIYSDAGRPWNGFKTDTCEEGGTTFSGSETCNGISRGQDGCEATSHCNIPYDYVQRWVKRWPVSQFPKFVNWDISSLDEFCPAPTPAPTPVPTPSPTNAPTGSPTQVETRKRKRGRGGKTKKVGSSSGDPHFKTWTGDKYDYHGECDLVLVDSPTFNGGQGLRVHIRTTRVKYFSFIEKVALQIGNDVLEFDNDVENFLINGEKVEANHKHHRTMFAGFAVRRDKRAISVRLSDKMAGGAKIDFHTRKNGFPAIILDSDNTDIFRGSLGLLGEWHTGRKLARDGTTEIEVDPVDASAFALEWQVRDTEPMLFKETRFPQYPTVCIPPKKMAMNRLGNSLARQEAEEACSHWKIDVEDCIFDVLASGDVLVAQEGHIVHIE